MKIFHQKIKIPAAALACLLVNVDMVIASQDEVEVQGVDPEEQLAKQVELPVANTSPLQSNRFDNSHQQFKFPEWPIRKQHQRVVMPPPPPGPYMSTALSDDYSMRGFAFSQTAGQSALEGDAHQQDISDAEISMDTFSPDRPWPKDMRSHIEEPQRWMPESGYQFVQPAAGPKSQAGYYGYPHRGPDIGYMRMPSMSWNGRQMPDVGNFRANPPVFQYQREPVPNNNTRPVAPYQPPYPYGK